MKGAVSDHAANLETIEQAKQTLADIEQNDLLAGVSAPSAIALQAGSTLQSIEEAERDNPPALPLPATPRPNHPQQQGEELLTPQQNEASKRARALIETPPSHEKDNKKSKANDTLNESDLSESSSDAPSDSTVIEGNMETSENSGTGTAADQFPFVPIILPERIPTEAYTSYMQSSTNKEFTSLLKAFQDETIECTKALMNVWNLERQELYKLTSRLHGAVQKAENLVATHEADLLQRDTKIANLESRLNAVEKMSPIKTNLERDAKAEEIKGTYWIDQMDAVARDVKILGIMNDTTVHPREVLLNHLDKKVADNPDDKDLEKGVAQLKDDIQYAWYPHPPVQDATSRPIMIRVLHRRCVDFLMALNRKYTRAENISFKPTWPNCMIRSVNALSKKGKQIKEKDSSIEFTVDKIVNFRKGTVKLCLKTRKGNKGIFRIMNDKDIDNFLSQSPAPEAQIIAGGASSDNEMEQ